MLLGRRCLSDRERGGRDRPGLLGVVGTPVIATDGASETPVLRREEGAWLGREEVYDGGCGAVLGRDEEKEACFCNAPGAGRDSDGAVLGRDERLTGVCRWGLMACWGRLS